MRAEALLVLRPRLPVPGSRRLGVGLLLFAPVLLAALLPGALAPYDPWASVAPPFEAPSLAHPFGTDDLGRDLLSAVIAGARTSLAVGFAVAGMAAAVGLVMGVTAGSVGGWTDDVLMRATEIVQIVPRFFIAILVVGLFGATIDHLILVLGLTSWPGLARIARAEALSLRARDFVRAARALGGGTGWIIRRHILPNASQPIVAALSLIVCGAILTEAGLSYLGLSDPNVVSWGRLLDNAQAFLYRAWWLSIFPGAAIALTVVAIALIVDGWRRP